MPFLAPTVDAACMVLNCNVPVLLNNILALPLCELSQAGQLYHTVAIFCMSGGNEGSSGVFVPP